MSRTEKYVVKPRLRKKSWWADRKILWDIVEHYNYWHDSSYGNGGGDWYSSKRVIDTFDTEEEAQEYCKTLNKYI